MSPMVIMVIGPGILAIASGMLGLGIAFAVMPPSFSSLIPHMAMARSDSNLTPALLFVGAAGSFFGARLTSLYVPRSRIKQIFGVLIVVMTVYKIYTLI